MRTIENHKGLITTIDIIIVLRLAIQLDKSSVISNL